MNRNTLFVVCLSILGALLPSCSPQTGDPTDERDCIPDCRVGYTCDRISGQCVSECNPPCHGGEYCDTASNSCKPETGGTGGTAGASGTGGSTGGSAGDGGTAGTGGSSTGGSSTGGAAGTGGSSTGGSAGEADAGGAAGTGGDAGTGGSSTGGSAGDGGSAGTGGSAGDGGTSTGGTAGGDAGTGGTDAGGTGGVGGSAGTGGSAGDGGSAGTGGAPQCSPDGSTRPCGPATDVGECAIGTETCQGGVWGTCAGAVYPATETCNYLDDDCDGVVDNGSLLPTAAINLGVTTGVAHPAATLNKMGDLGIIWTRSQKEIWFTLRDRDGNTIPPIPWIENQVASSDSSAGAWAVDALSLQQNSFTDFWSAWTERSYGSQKIQVSTVRQDWGNPSADPLGNGPSAHPITAAKPGVNENEYGLVFENGSPPDIYFSRHTAVSRVGGCQISSNAGASTRPQVVWNGATWVVVWNDTTTIAAGEWRYAIVPDNGSAVTSNGSLGAGSGDFSLVAGPNGTVAMASAENGQTVLRRFDSTMSALGSTEIVATSPHGFSLSWTGVEYGLAWSSGSPGDVWLARVGPEGQLGAVVNATNSLGDSEEPSVVWSSGDWLIVYVDDTSSGRALFLTKVTRNCL